MKTTTHIPMRLLLLLLVVLGAALGPGPAWADDRPAPAIALAARAQGSIEGVTDPRHAALLLRGDRDRSVEPGTISRPAPADNLAARAPESSPAPVATAPADGFDLRDALIGAVIALGAALLAAAGTLALSRSRRAASPA